MSRVSAAFDFTDCPERAVEVEFLRYGIDDLLQRSRDDVHTLAALLVLARKRERLPVDEGFQDRLECGCNEIAELVGRESLEHAQAVLRHTLHRRSIGAAGNKEQLHECGLGELTAADQSAISERTRERKRARAAQERAVEIEKRGRGHGPSVGFGVVPDWFVVNARDAQWYHHDSFGDFCIFESKDDRFPQLGINIGILYPGTPNCMYHREGAQEDFLVLRGECLLIVEGEERRMKAWDFFHCPPGTEHVFVGAGDEPCVMIAVGARPDDPLFYPVNEVARKHGAGVEKETPSPEEAYAKYGPSQPAPIPEAF
jgi:uncharacterized cupin superfamily protein